MLINTLTISHRKIMNANYGYFCIHRAVECYLLVYTCDFTIVICLRMRTRKELSLTDSVTENHDSPLTETRLNELTNKRFERLFLATDRRKLIHLNESGNPPLYTYSNLFYIVWPILPSRTLPRSWFHSQLFCSFLALFWCHRTIWMTKITIQYLNLLLILLILSFANFHFVARRILRGITKPVCRKAPLIQAYCYNFNVVVCCSANVSTFGKKIAYSYLVPMVHR